MRTGTIGSFPFLCPFPSLFEFLLVSSQRERGLLIFFLNIVDLDLSSSNHRVIYLSVKFSSRLNFSFEFRIIRNFGIQVSKVILVLRSVDPTLSKSCLDLSWSISAKLVIICRANNVFRILNRFMCGHHSNSSWSTSFFFRYGITSTNLPSDRFQQELPLQMLPCWQTVNHVLSILSRLFSLRITQSKWLLPP